MKKKFIVLTILILVAIVFFICNMEGMENLNQVVSINNVETVNQNDIEKLIANKQEASYDLLKFEYDGVSLPYDDEQEKYYFSTNENCDFKVYFDKKTTIKKIISDGNIEIVAYNKHKYKKYDIMLTQFPIVNIELSDKTKKKELISDEYIYGNIIIFDNESLKTIQQTSKFKIRGATSRLFEKKGYTIKFIDSKSGNEIIRDDVLGLDPDYGYALNSLYEDESKIRDILSNYVWQNINIDKSKNINIKYVEVIINNQYYGLYGLQELSDEYKFKIDGTNSILYKINNSGIAYLNNLDEDMRNSTEIVYSSKAYEESWQYLKNLMELVYYADDQKFNKEILDYIDLDNLVDNFILMETIYNFDGLLKNDVLEYNIDTGKFIKIPWDLDLTFGKIWDSNKVLKSTNKMELSKQLLADTGNDAISIYLEQRLWENNVGNFRQKVAQKWSTLRKGFLQTESFVNYANSLYDEVTESGAREREHERWPDGGYSTDNKFIETFIRQRLEYLDGEFLKYLDDDIGGN